MCGENLLKTCSNISIIGSPPRVRGKRHTPFPDKKKSRITPACAGKTLSVGNDTGNSGDHPRVCGENVHRPNHRRSAGRITPACAGKTRLL